MKRLTAHNELIRLGELELLPSQVLFHVDLEAYKAALGDFITERDGEGDDEKIAAQEEEREGEVE